MYAPAVRDPEIVFTIARGENAFFLELAEALAVELRRLGANARVVVGEIPEPTKGRVHVILPPHEFVVLSGFRPPPAMLRRCILISAEQPTSHFFGENVEMARAAGAVFDINQRAVRAYQGNGIAATHLSLGYTESWDASAAAPERDIDVLFLGRFSDRRAVALSRYADVLERLRCHFLMSDNSRPNAAAGPAFATGEAKRLLLARSKVLLNIHGEDEPYFEWLRVAEAICCGAVVVSEHSTDIEPLTWGHHVITGELDALGLLAATIVDDDGMRAEIAANAITQLKTHSPLSRAAQELLVAARRIAGRRVTPDAKHAARVGELRAATTAPFEKPLQPTIGFVAGESISLRAIKHQVLQLTNVRRELEGLKLAWTRPNDPVARTVRSAVSRAWAFGRRPDVSVVVPLYNHAASVREALDSVLQSDHQDWELIVVDDGSTDDSGEVVREWIERHSYRRCLLLRHEVNRGLAPARNTGAEYARAEKILMLDSDNLLRRKAISRLSAALEQDPEAAFAYGILERFSDYGSEGLLSVYGWEPERLRQMNYIDALAMVRRSALESVGGYSTDSRLALGWEDYDLWVRFAEAGRRGAFVPEMIARYRVGHSSMVSITNLSVTDALAALVDHAPNLMSGLEIPGA
jgi:hypothetical protein